MLRASSCSGSTFPTSLRRTLNLSLLLSHNLSSSPLNSPKFPIVLPRLSLSHSTRFSPISPLILFPCFRLALPMTGNSSLKGRASFSASSNGGGGREILVQHLLVREENLKLISEVQQKIAAGDDLSDLAVEYSICPSKEQGGMLGWVRKGQMVPEFEEAAFSAPLKKVVKCKTKFGWHLLEVLSEREETSVQEIEPEELHVKMQDPSFLEEAQLIDVREPDEVARASLSGFLVLPLRQFGSWSSEITTKFDPQKDTYVMCHHGVRSLQVAKWLLTQGFMRVSNVTGGIHAYAVMVDPSVPTY